MDKYSDELESLDKELNRYQRKIEKIRKPLAKRIIIQPKYFERNTCNSRKNSFERAEFKDTIIVILSIKITDVRKRGLLILFI